MEHPAEKESSLGMKLTYFQGDPPNFGDELNATMWTHLLPSGLLDGCEDELFLGVGSILWDYLPKAPRKIVAGSGFGGYTAVPDVHDGKWDILWLRGPLTARALGVDPGLVITDAAVLLRATPLPPPARNVGIAFMPHVESIARGAWIEVCAAAGITFLDPRAPVDGLLAQIRGASLVITEAMHGAIVADAVRTPWVPVLPFHPTNRAKWDDWAQSLDIRLASVSLHASTLREAWVSRTGFQATGRRSQLIFDNTLIHPFNKIAMSRAVTALSRIAATSTPQLSSDIAIARATDRALAALNGFVVRRADRTERQPSVNA
jgi:succinoglycan biosynthesis protein ExoV